jgi:hypothetical protein
MIGSTACIPGPTPSSINCHNTTALHPTAAHARPRNDHLQLTHVDDSLACVLEQLFTSRLHAAPSLSTSFNFPLTQAANTFAIIARNDLPSLASHSGDTTFGVSLADGCAQGMARARLGRREN